jgi:putative peptidoglycan lipid II flippase
MERTGKLARAISIVTVITLFSKVLGFIREAVQASTFGTQASTDCYTLAFNDTIYLFTTLAFALCIAAVPMISQRLIQDREDGLILAGNLISISLIVSLAITLIGLLFPYQFFVTGNNALQTITYVRIMFLSLPVIVLTYLLVALFQSMEHFALQGCLSLPYNVFLIGWLVLASDKYGLSGLVVAVTAAWLLQLSMTLPLIRKEQIRLRFKPNFKAEYLSGFLRTAIVTGVTSSTYLFCYLMNARSAAGLGAGMVTAFYYADKLFTPLVTTLVYSISTVLFPKFNQQYVKEPLEYHAYVKQVIHKMLLIILPVSVILSVCSKAIIRVLFERGDFTRLSTDVTGGILGIYALGMTAFAVIDLLNKAFFTMENRSAPLLATGGTLLINLILGYFLHNGMKVAFGTVFAMTFGAVLLLFFFFKGKGLKSLFLPGIRILAATALMGAALWYCFSLLIDLNDGALILMVKCICLGGTGMILYLLLCMLMGERFFKPRHRKNGAI